MKTSVGVTHYPRVIAVFFIAVIAVGTLLLALPVSSKAGQWTPLVDALFTATSASCVTGLVVYDTYMHWSLFGQSVILVLIQVGGIGLMALAASFSLLLRRRIGLNERIMLMEASGSKKLGGVVRLTKKILIGMLLFEGAGTALLALRFCGRMGIKEGLYNAVFHSVSAFCNAGFDLMGKYGAFSSLTAFSNDFVVCMVIAVLIVAGSIGFFVWDDISTAKMRWSRFSLHTKIVLATTLALVVTGAVFIFFAEEGGAMQGMGVAERLVSSLFHSVSIRTAGFTYIDVSALSGAQMFMTVLLMIVGGSPSSAAGGIKTTTLFTVIAATRASLRNERHITAFSRQLDDSALRRACAIITVYIFMALSGVVLLSLLQSFPLSHVVFDVFSAASSVGLSLGIVPQLEVLPKLVIVCLMYFSRAGLLSIVFSLISEQPTERLRYPKEQIIIG